MFDACAPALAAGYAVGRIGCQLSGDGDYGKPTDSFLGMSYPDGTVPTTEDVWPTPVFETVAMALVALLLWRLRDRYRPGVLFGLYLLLAGHRAPADRVHPPQRRGGGRADPAAADRRGDDRLRRGRSLVVRQAAAPARAGRRKPPEQRPAAGRRAQRQRHRGPGRAAQVVRRVQADDPGADRHGRTRGHGPRRGCGRSRPRPPPAPPARPAPAGCPAPAPPPRRRWPAPAAGPGARAPGRMPSAGPPPGSKATAASGRCSAASASAARQRQRAGGRQVGAGHAQRIAEQQLLQPRRGVGPQRQQHAEPERAADHDGGGRVRPDPAVARGQRHGQRGHRDPAGGAQDQRRARQGGHHQPGQEPVGQRLRGVGQPVAADPEAERPAEQAQQHDLGQRAAVDPGVQRAGQEVDHQCGWSWCWTATARTPSRPSPPGITISSRP